jgi:cobalamin biosynthesis protein CbiG
VPTRLVHVGNDAAWNAEQVLEEVGVQSILQPLAVLADGGLDHPERRRR